MKRATWLMMVMLAPAGATLVGERAQGPASGRVIPDAAVEEAALIERFLHSGAPELATYTAQRRLMASTRGGRMQAWLEAWTALDADGMLRFEVVCSGGSELIQKRVLVAALEAERRSRQQRETGQAALTRDNYEFTETTPPGEGVREILLRPRRRSQMLIEGAMLVREPSADLVRVEGRLSKTPSWWTRRVEIVRRYTRIGGVRVPVEMTSTADVRLVGTASFAMAYDYATINGNIVSEGVSPACRSGAPSPSVADLAARVR